MIHSDFTHTISIVVGCILFVRTGWSMKTDIEKSSDQPYFMAWFILALAAILGGLS